jgi:hypothetical protein
VAKVHVPIRALRLLGAIGVAPRVVSVRDDGSGYYINIMTGARQPYFTSYKSTYDPTLGLVLGGGFDWGVGRIRFTPQLRYIHWNQRFLDETVRREGFLGLVFYRAADTQFDIMLGISWRSH